MCWNENRFLPDVLEQSMYSAGRISKENIKITIQYFLFDTSAGKIKFFFFYLVNPVLTQTNQILPSLIYSKNSVTSPLRNRSEKEYI
jgi:hypothetical protein